MNIHDYKTIIFDCDGVILDSNIIKTDAFYEAVLEYGEEKARALKEYHTTYGGISRYEKFTYFFTELVPVQDKEEKIKAALESFGRIVKEKLINCSLTDGFTDFINVLESGEQSKMVVSGGKQSELREVFRLRNLDGYFGAIFGSPDDKKVILEREIKENRVLFPALYIGDSKYDYETASSFDIDFIFMYKYSEFKNWKSYFDNKKDVHIIESYKDLL